MDDRTRTLLRNGLALIQRLEGGDEHDRLRALAHLWALLDLLSDRAPWNPKPVLHAATSPQSVLSALNAGPLRLTDLVEGLRQHLAGQAGLLADAIQGRLAVRPVRLERVSDGDEEQLGGTVVWARRGLPSAWARHLARREQGPHATDYRRLPSRDSGPFSLVWNRPGAPKVALHRQPLTAHHPLRFVLCPGPPDAWPRLKRFSPYQFRACPEQPINGPGDRLSWLRETLRLAREEGASCFVLPELMVPPDVREVLREEWGGIFIPGSAHEGGDEQLQNRGWVLSPSAPDVAHQKAGRFRVQGEKWRSLHSLDAAQPDPTRHHLAPDPFPLPSADDDVVEGIHPGDSLQIVETPAARMGLLICADLLDRGAKLRERVEEAQVELLIVPSYSGETQPFVQAANELRAHRVGLLWVNAAAAVRDDELLALVSLPFRTLGLPTRLRWRRDKGLQDDKGQTWRHPEAARLLPDGRGLLVDLQAWMDEEAESE